MGRFRLACHLIQFGGEEKRDPDKVLREVAEAGWDGVFIEDYLVWQGHQDMLTCDPWIGLAAMATTTQRSGRIFGGGRAEGMRRRHPLPGRTAPANQFASPRAAVALPSGLS